MRFFSWPKLLPRLLFLSRSALSLPVLSLPVLTRTTFALTCSAALNNAVRVLHFAWGLPGAGRRGLLQLVGVFLVFELDEVSYVKKRIALQAEVDKCRLHAR